MLSCTAAVKLWSWLGAMLAWSMVYLLVAARGNHFESESTWNQMHHQFGQIVCIFQSRRFVILMKTGPGNCIWKCKSAGKQMLLKRNSMKIFNQTNLRVVLLLTDYTKYSLIWKMGAWARENGRKKKAILTSNARRISIQAFMHSYRWASFRMQSRYK